MKLVIIDYGAGNIQSLRFALDRLGVESLLSSNAEEIKKAGGGAEEPAKEAEVEAS